MTRELVGRNLLSLVDYSGEEIRSILELGFKLKHKQKEGQPHNFLEGRTLAMIFQKSSTRTRLSFEVGMEQLGGRGLFLSVGDLQMGRGEPVKDTARTLSRYVDGIMIRTFDQEEVEELARYASVPVINGLTDRFHPCQALADLMSVWEKCGELAPERKVVYLGDGNNVAHSLMLGCSKLGLQLRVAHPPGYAPDGDIVELARREARSSGGELVLMEDPEQAVKGCEVVYTDVWTSMGQESEKEEKRKHFAPYQLNRALLDKAEPGAVVMHCLPAHRGEEITDQVIESEQSVVFDQAENRLHAQKALLSMLIK